MRIAIAVHGRFHAFDLAAALLGQGHEVELLTNLPRSKVAHWFPAERTSSALWHGALARVANRLAGGEPPALVEAALKRGFGRWAARQLGSRAWDVVHPWSGIAEEIMRSGRARTYAVARGSAHIAAQSALLEQEEVRTGQKLERPSRWIMAREQREYALAHRIVVPSEFARRTFLEHGVAAHKVAVIPLSTREAGFQAGAAEIDARAQRLLAGDRLRVLYVGMLSYGKGMYDMARVIERLHTRMDFRMVGPVLPECRAFAREAARMAVVDAAVPRSELPAIYAWGDVFLLPTIQDGFAVVLAQAQAAGLPIITTSNSGGPEIIANGGQGWITAARDAEAMIEQLMWCHHHRQELAQMVTELHRAPPRRDWNDVARDFVNAVSA